MFPGKHRGAIAGTAESARIRLAWPGPPLFCAAETIMTNDVAVFLDLDNLVIGARQSNLSFDITLVLDHIKKATNGRIVLRHAYGAGRQSQGQLQELAHAGFIVQSATRINSYSKNLADMQIVVNAMETLVDGHHYNTYVLMSGDRDFTPLVQALRKRGKHVIGVGIRRTTSSSLVELCDEYIYYEDLLPTSDLKDAELEDLIISTRDALLKDKSRVRASLFKQRMTALSDGRFDSSSYPQGSFRGFLQRYPRLIQLEQEDSTTYILAPGSQEITRPLYVQYRTTLKKRRLRVIPPQQRFAILHALITVLNGRSDLVWQDTLNAIHEKIASKDGLNVSKNMINAMLLVARQADVVRTLKGKTLASAPILLEINGERPFQETIICIDSTYLQAILDLPEPFDFIQASLALYDNESFVPYLQRIAQR